MKTTKLIYLESIRGIAACIVVLAHFLQIFYPSVFTGNPNTMHGNWEINFSKSIGNIFYNGQFAVSMFFVLSGFVLSYSYFKNGRASTIVNSFIRRYPRLAIPGAISCFAMLCLYQTRFYKFPFIREETGTRMLARTETMENMKEVLTNLFYHNYFTHGAAYNPVIGTMTYELFGSLLVYLFLLLFGKSHYRWIAYSILIAFFSTHEVQYTSFIFGMILCDFYVSYQQKETKPVGLGWIFLLLAVGITMGSYPYYLADETFYSWLPDVADPFLFYHIIGSTLILLAILLSTRLQEVLNGRLFEHLGKLSFPMYLVHFFVLESVGSYVFYHTIKTMNYHVSALLTGAVSIVFIWLFAEAMRIFIDQPTIRLVKKLNVQRTQKFIVDRQKQAA